MKASLKDRYRRRDEFHWEAQAEGGVIYDHHESLRYELNATAFFIWSALDGIKNVEQIAQELELIYEGDKRKLQKDVAKSLQQLFDDDLISREP